MIPGLRLNASISAMFASKGKDGENKWKRKLLRSQRLSKINLRERYIRIALQTVDKLGLPQAQKKNKAKGKLQEFINGKAARVITLAAACF